MDNNVIISKIKKVFYSCKTVDQVEQTFLWADKVKFEYENMFADWNRYLFFSQIRNEMVSYLKNRK